MQRSDRRSTLTPPPGRLLLRELAMRRLLAAGCLSLLSGCAGSPEGRARDVSLALVKSNNSDEVMKLTTTPFAVYSATAKGYHVEYVAETPDELRTRLKSLMDKGRPDRPTPTDVLEVIPAAMVKDGIGAKMSPEVWGVVERVMGPDGFVVVLGLEGKPVTRMIVAMKDGKAKVAGGLP